MAVMEDSPQANAIKKGASCSKAPLHLFEGVEQFECREEKSTFAILELVDRMVGRFAERLIASS